MQSTDYAVYRVVIEEVLAGQEQMPSLPTITLKIRQAVSDPDITHKKIADLISHDPSLSALLLKNASSPLFRTAVKPTSLEAVISLLGLGTVDQLVMMHSVKSLFVMHSPVLKKLFKLSWRRQVLKSAISQFLAQRLGHEAANEAMIASLLSEIGTLATLSAFKDNRLVPDVPTYCRLCREYSKSLGIVLLKKWGVSEYYTDVVRRSGCWEATCEGELDLVDVINLALFHTVQMLKSRNTLPAIETLALYPKLESPFDITEDHKQLQLVTLHRKEIMQSAQLFG